MPSVQFYPLLNCPISGKPTLRESKSTSVEVLNFWYSGEERAPLYNRPCMNTGYAIFAVNRYKVHTQLLLAVWYARRESNSQRPLRRGLLYPFNYERIFNFGDFSFGCTMGVRNCDFTLPHRNVTQCFSLSR